MIGAVRLPIAGPYRPLARCYVAADGTEYWTVRLWEFDRAIERTVDAGTLRRYAERSGLSAVVDQIDALIERAASGRRR